MTSVNKESRTVDFFWVDGKTYNALSYQPRNRGDDPIIYLVDLGQKPYDEALEEAQDYVAGWQCRGCHDCCAHRFALGGSVFRRFGRTFARIRTDINV